MEGGYGSSTDGDTCESTTDNNRNKNRKSKRNRTTFTDEQIHILQANFQIDCNPDGQDLERIADISGLSKRVVQVFIIVILSPSSSSGHHPANVSGLVPKRPGSQQEIHW